MTGFLYALLSKICDRENKEYPPLTLLHYFCNIGYTDSNVNYGNEPFFALGNTAIDTVALLINLYFFILLIVKN